MKVRMDFVTNSSSSSYMVAKRGDKEWNNLLTSNEIDYIETHAMKADNFWSLERMFLEKHRWEVTVHGDTIADLYIDHYDGRRIKIDFDSIMELILKGYTIYSFSIDRDDEYNAGFDFSLPKEGDFVLIEKEST